MPFKKMPPEENIRAFIEDLAKHNITVDRATIERDLDRIMFGVQTQTSVDAAMQETLKSLPASTRANIQQYLKQSSAEALSPELTLITEAIDRHFSGYFE